MKQKLMLLEYSSSNLAREGRIQFSQKQGLETDLQVKTAHLYYVDRAEFLGAVIH